MIERGFPAILQEMDGIARGAGLDFADTLPLNCISGISLTRASGGGGRSDAVRAPSRMNLIERRLSLRHGKPCETQDAPVATL